MNFIDVKLDDPRWTPHERVILSHLFRTRQRYIAEGRKLEAHGMAKAIYVMANVIEALETQAAEKPLPDYDATKFQTLL
jgi:hypothetical protein